MDAVPTPDGPLLAPPGPADAAQQASAPFTVFQPRLDVPPAIEVDGVATSYRIHVGASTAWSGVMDLMRRTSATDRVVPALRDITFQVPQGSVFCIIGRNGAGKSTLLRCIAGILAPESGRIVVRGRISSLLSVGVGMNPELSGRENIRLGGLAMGLDEDRLDDITGDIADFAELGEYLDYPVNAYSLGMRSRLGFSVAAHLDPEVLLIDEALTGGDSKFKDKVADKMFELCNGGRTIVLVTHGLSAVRDLATSAMWMHQGKVIEGGDPDDVLSSYMRYCRISSRDMHLAD